ncbi:DinB family protein [Daejeonella oryzae]|uniref:DinB family protein n=1 Tax=Daejeonella oryzae TaxID=1122943 RepID=UPI00041C7198|nr:DinB family protein [Daejeonella oryzae]
MNVDKLNETLDIWITALKQYDFDTLVAKPDSENWSLGQVFRHLINETSYYIGQIEYCLTHHENSLEQMEENAGLIFANNEFPNERIKNDSPSSQNVKQPVKKTELLEEMHFLKTQLNQQWKKINENVSSGKTRHPGLGYFNAREWFQFSELHLRHHLRQRKRIEISIKYLPQNNC